MSWAAHVLRVPAHGLTMDAESDCPDEQEWQALRPETCTHWQFWQSKADFTPVSPVFATSEEMAAYAVSQNGWPWFLAFMSCDKDTAKKWIEDEGDEFLNRLRKREHR